MGDFDFLEKPFAPLVNTSVEDEAIAAYFNMRQGFRQSLESSRFGSSLSVLSLNKTSFTDAPLTDSKRSPETAQLFKRPKTPPPRNNNSSVVNYSLKSHLQAELNKADDVLTRAKSDKVPSQQSQGRPFERLSSTISPQTPRQFFDGLNSLTPESMNSIHLENTSIRDSVNFPLRDKDDILDMLEREKRKFIPNSSGFSHNSDLTHFSSTRCSKVGAELDGSISDFFTGKSDSISSLLKGSRSAVSSNDKDDENKTILAIQKLLQNDLSGTAIGDRLLGTPPEQKAFEAVEGILQEAPMTTSTPMVRRPAWHPSTPVRPAVFREPKHLPLDVSDASNDNDLWFQLRQSRIEDGVPKKSKIYDTDSTISVLPGDRENKKETKFSLTPSSIDFPVLPIKCHEDKKCSFTCTSEGDITLDISIKNEAPPSASPFVILRDVQVENGSDKNDVSWKTNGFHIKLLGGGKHVVDFSVRFQPCERLGLSDAAIAELNARVVLAVIEGISTQVVAECPVHGATANGKFVCRSDSSPLVFNVAGKNAALTRAFQVKNVGPIPLQLRLEVADTPLSETTTLDEHFTVPDVVSIPVGKIISINITFTATQNYVRKYLIISLMPNGKTSFDVELIGQVSEIEPPAYQVSSRSSIKSGSSAVSRQSESFNIKLTVSDYGLSWMATPLQSEELQSFQVKLISEAAASVRVQLTNSSDVFKLINERGEALSKMKKTLTPGVPLTINVRFKPDCIGLHCSQIEFKLHSSSKPSKVDLTGYGGAPKIRIENTLLDLHGNRMVKLAHPESEQFVLSGTFQIRNLGNAPAFALITPDITLIGMAHRFSVQPEEYVLLPNQNLSVKLSLKLSRSEVHDILRGHEILKVASLNIITGDEPSRRRFQWFRSDSENFNSLSEVTKKLISISIEDEANPVKMRESKVFEARFMASLRRCDVAVVLDRNSHPAELSVLDLDESTLSFATLSETVIHRTADTQVASEQSMVQTRKSSFSSQDMTSRKVQEWLRRVD